MSTAQSPFRSMCDIPAQSFPSRHGGKFSQIVNGDGATVIKITVKTDKPGG
jgi:hypothetical protein